MSLLAISQALGQDRSVTLRWVESLGCPYLRRADRALGHEWQLDLGDVVRWHVEHERKVVLSETGAGADIEPKDRLILLKIAKEANLLVPVASVEAVYERANGQARQAVISASTRLARSMDGFPADRVSAWTLQADAILRDVLKSWQTNARAINLAPSEHVTVVTDADAQAA